MKNYKNSAILIAAPKSNSGKTLVTLGLIKALLKKGLQVQAFKCGPDYIDPMHHSKISGKASYNLDLWMSSEKHVEDIFYTKSAEADVSVVEGVMGLFDGARKDVGSSASIARLLKLPVVLVVDASSMAYSAAPLLYGFKNFDHKINLAGVIFNKVGSESHFNFLKEAAADAGVTVLGYVPKDNRLAIESRHLGLHLPNENNGEELIETVSELIEEHIDLDVLLNQSIQEFKLPEPEKNSKEVKKLRIALAHDEAFNFTYQANRDALEKTGEIIEFSPIHDKKLPKADIIWLPGGYPELFAGELMANEAMKQEIFNFAESGKAVIAECGGMMYLGNKLITKDGSKYKMTGVFDYNTSFETSKLYLGYRELTLPDFCIKGHEFHYSHLISKSEKKYKVEVRTARNKTAEMPVFRKKNCWASYMHLYLGEENAMKHFLKELGL